MIRKLLVPVFEKLLDVIFVLGVLGFAISGAFSTAYSVFC